MKGRVESFIIEEMKVTVYLPEQKMPARYPVMYVNQSSPDDWNDLLPLLEGQVGRTVQPFMMVCVQPTGWNRDYSPWQAQPLMADGEPFSGGADARIACMVDCIKPAVDERYPTLADPAHTALMGYSLGGLAALYALYKTPTFGMVACLSGSLWYEGFMHYMSAHQVLDENARVYLSLGRKEPKTRHRLMSHIGECYIEAEKLLGKQLKQENLCFEWNNGGHMTDVARRHLSACQWLMRMPQKP